LETNFLLLPSQKSDANKSAQSRRKIPPRDVQNHQ